MEEYKNSLAIIEYNDKEQTPFAVIAEELLELFSKISNLDTDNELHRNIFRRIVNDLIDAFPSLTERLRPYIDIFLADRLNLDDDSDQEYSSLPSDSESKALVLCLKVLKEKGTELENLVPILQDLELPQEAESLILSLMNKNFTSSQKHRTIEEVRVCKEIYRKHIQDHEEFRKLVRESSISIQIFRSYQSARAEAVERYKEKALNILKEVLSNMETIKAYLNNLPDPNHPES